jgi:hypothetical protein
MNEPLGRNPDELPVKRITPPGFRYGTTISVLGSVAACRKFFSTNLVSVMVSIGSEI